jgi:hypothetical protein
MNNQYNVWCKWHKLKTVVLGDCYPVEFFRDIKNDRIRSALTQITEETLEDLEYYEKVLKEFGCKVIRPNIDKNLSIMDFIDNGKLKSVPRSPLQPRDMQFVLGNKLYLHDNDANGEFVKLFENYNHNDIDDYSSINLNVIHTKNIEPSLPLAPSCTLVGKDLYVDFHSQNISPNVFKYYQSNHKDLRLNVLKIGGHNDGCFHTLKNGAIISLYEIQHYEKTFPNWDICYLPKQSWFLIDGFMKMKKKVNGKWWVPNEEDNDEFTYFVEIWLQDWVGYCEESVFDVNVLMLDEHHVCVNNYNETAFTFFKKHKVEPIIVPWRHRYFWDGGLHCITLDLYREGVMEDYFPDRKKGIIDLGF